MKMMTDVFICPSTGWGVFLVYDEEECELYARVCDEDEWIRIWLTKGSYPILKKPKFGADNSAIAAVILSWRRWKPPICFKRHFNTGFSGNSLLCAGYFICTLPKYTAHHLWFQSKKWKKMFCLALHETDVPMVRSCLSASMHSAIP